MKILDGRQVAQKVLQRLARQLYGQRLTLAILSVGRNPVSQKYLEQKQKACQSIGLGFKPYNFPVGTAQAVLKAAIERVADDQGVTGIVVQLPLPKGLPTDEILNSIPPAKDVDCLTMTNVGRFCQGQALILPPVVGAVKKLFEEYKIKLPGKRVVVVGAGRLVGLPVSLWLVQQGATVTVCNKLTKSLPDFTRSADIVISGVGRPNLITGSMIKKGAVIVDCGASTDQGKVVGDIETSSVVKKAGFLAPVPGGVGPLTVACLLENLLKLNNAKNSRS